MNPYMWLYDYEWAFLMNTFSFSYIKGTDLESTLGRLGANRLTASLTYEEVLTRKPFVLDQAVAAREAGDWIFIWAIYDTDIGSQRSFSQMEAVVVSLSINSDLVFRYCGPKVGLIEADARYPQDTPNLYSDLLSQTAGMQGATEEPIPHAEANALALAENLTGVRVTPELIRGKYTWAEMSHPSNVEP